MQIRHHEIYFDDPEDNEVNREELDNLKKEVKIMEHVKPINEVLGLKNYCIYTEISQNKQYITAQIFVVEELTDKNL